MNAEKEYSKLLSAQEEADLSEIIKASEAARYILENCDGEVAPEERELLLQTIQDGGEAQHKLSRANIRLVINIAKKHIGKGVELDDLIQEGHLGLIRATRDFDSDKARFSTHATWWVRQEIGRLVTEEGWRVAPHIGEELRKLWEIQEKYSLEHAGELPSAEELASLLDINVEHAMFLLRVSHLAMKDEASMEEEVAEDLARGELLLDESTPNPEEAAHTSQLQQIAEKILSTLNPMEEFIIRHYYGLNEEGVSYTFGEIKEKLEQEKGIKRSPQMLRIIHKKVINRFSQSQTRELQILKSFWEME